MRKIVILGSGAGGTMVASQLSNELDDAEWEITIIDEDEQHHYQSGYLFIPFGIYDKSDILKSKKEFIPKGVNFVVDSITKVDKEARCVETAKGKYDYDWLVIATGVRIMPEEIDGMADKWGEDVFDFYTLEGALKLRKKMKYFSSGKVVLNIAEVPYKCPIAPLEFVFMADWFFTANGVRDKVEIEFVTPLDNVFTKPVAAKTLSKYAGLKNIKVTPYFDIAQVNANEKTIESQATYDGHATCFLASGFEKAILLDFNYNIEPLPGKFPFPGMGPFSLLQETLGNHWGKMMFRWVYWNLMMKGLELPLEPQMNIAGKVRQAA